jgi:hypothetical protein
MKGWQWRDTEAEYRRGLELNPNDAGAYRGFGGGWLMLQGRLDTIDRDRQSSPFSINHGHWLPMEGDQPLTFRPCHLSKIS